MDLRHLRHELQFAWESTPQEFEHQEARNWSSRFRQCHIQNVFEVAPAIVWGFFKRKYIRNNKKIEGKARQVNYLT